MKIRFLLVFGVFALANPFNSNANDQEVGTACKCYCSDVCGPRDKRPDDKPFHDKEFGLCFCKMRDKNNFVSHRCNFQPRPDLNCCKKSS
jgi:hypothetical protein